MIILRIIKKYDIIRSRGVVPMIFRRKIYDMLLQWKEKSAGEKALMIEGARRIGKSTIV